MATIVVLGAGIGGVSQAFELKPLLQKNDRVIVVEPWQRLATFVYFWHLKR